MQLLSNVAGTTATGERDAALFEWEPVSAGHLRSVTLPDGSTADLQTLSVDPPVFLVPGLLSHAEADKVIEQAVGLMTGISETKGSQGEDGDLKDLEAGGGRARRVLAAYASDAGRSRLLPRDLAFLAQELFGMPNHNRTELEAAVGLAAQADGAISVYELTKRSRRLVEYLKRVVKEQPHRRTRYSEQSWLPHDGGAEMSALLRRVEDTTGATTTPLARTTIRPGTPCTPVAASAPPPSS